MPPPDSAEGLELMIFVGLQDLRLGVASFFFLNEQVELSFSPKASSSFRTLVALDVIELLRLSLTFPHPSDFPMKRPLAFGWRSDFSVMLKLASSACTSFLLFLMDPPYPCTTYFS